MSGFSLFFDRIPETVHLSYLSSLVAHFFVFFGTIFIPPIPESSHLLGAPGSLTFRPTTSRIYFPLCGNLPSLVSFSPFMWYVLLSKVQITDIARPGLGAPTWILHIFLHATLHVIALLNPLFC